MQGYRLTPQRQVILEAVRRAGDHVTPEQVYETVHAQQPAISRATIYRTLDFLCEQRLITAMHWGGQMYYEIAGETPHHHLICRTCGGLEEIDRALIELLIESTLTGRSAGSGSAYSAGVLTPVATRGSAKG